MNRKNFIIDFLILVAFLIASEPHLTGEPIHEWLSLAFAGALIVHILLHWKWIITVGVQYFRKLFHESRLQLLAGILLFISFTALVMSGLMISKTVLNVLNIQVIHNPTWKLVHTLSGKVSLYLVALHFALNWNWIAAMIKKHMIAPLKSLRKGNKQSLNPAKSPVNTNSTN